MIKLLVFDVDGCLSNGTITYTSSGEELKSFSVKDGLAISSWNRMGLKSAIITGRNSKVVQRRADELSISYLFQGIKDKLSKLHTIIEDEGILLSEVAILGDDLNDYHMLKAAGLSFCPSDGSSFIKEIVDVVLKTKGGEGAAREMIEIVLEKNGQTKEFLELWV